MYELEKSFGPNDFFFRHPATKKALGDEDVDFEKVGMFYKGPRWSERTGSSVVSRLNKYAVKYLNQRLMLEHKPGKLFNPVGF